MKQRIQVTHLTPMALSSILEYFISKANKLLKIKE